MKRLESRLSITASNQLILIILEQLLFVDVLNVLKWFPVDFNLEQATNYGENEF